MQEWTFLLKKTKFNAHFYQLSYKCCDIVSLYFVLSDSMCVKKVTFQIEIRDKFSEFLPKSNVCCYLLMYVYTNNTSSRKRLFAKRCEITHGWSQEAAISKRWICLFSFFLFPQPLPTYIILKQLSISEKRKQIASLLHPSQPFNIFSQIYIYAC